MNTFCTIITADYYPKVDVLYSSIKKFNANIEIQVLVADDKPVSAITSIPGKIQLIPARLLMEYSLVTDLFSKYADDIDSFRWSLKPVFISYLLEQGFDKVLYIDCDMFFVNDYNFLLSELDHASVLLTPNWINSDPLVNPDSFFSLFTSGFFSAGFIGANKNALSALQWWAKACHFMMGEQIQYGIRDDQKYLDVFPVKFETTKIIRHRGCNIGAWNYEECKRELVNGEVLINGEFPIIFIHFDGMLVQGILRGYDKLLAPYLQQYKQAFADTGADLTDFIKEINTHVDRNILIRLKWKLRLKNRIKQILYNLGRRL